MSNLYLDVVKMLKGYGFNRFDSTGRTHAKAYHPNLNKPVFFAKSPSDVRAIQKLESDVKAFLGLGNRGREAVVGERRTRKPRKSSRRPPPRQSVESRYDELASIEALMRGRP